MIRILGDAGEVAFVPFDGVNVRGDWDLRVGAGSTLPVSKSVMSQMAIQMFQMQAIDQRALLENVEFRIMRRSSSGWAVRSFRSPG
jgi:hypothetical protein